jgi:hypothetical protein
VGREEPCDSHPIIKECGGVWVFPGEVRVVPRPEHGQSEMQYFSESWIFPNFSLPQLLCDFHFPKPIPIPASWHDITEVYGDINLDIPLSTDQI